MYPPDSMPADDNMVATDFFAYLVDLLPVAQLHCKRKIFASCLPLTTFQGSAKRFMKTTAPSTSHLRSWRLSTYFRLLRWCIRGPNEQKHLVTRMEIPRQLTLRLFEIRKLDSLAQLWLHIDSLQFECDENKHVSLLSYFFGLYPLRCNLCWWWFGGRVLRGGEQWQLLQCVFERESVRLTANRR